MTAGLTPRQPEAVEVAEVAEPVWAMRAADWLAGLDWAAVA
jgi:hypothetical protein